MNNIKEILDKKVILINKEEKTLGQLFELDDFNIDQGGQIFIKHDALLRAFRKNFSQNKYEVEVVRASTNYEKDLAVVKVTYVFTGREFEESYSNTKTYYVSSVADCCPENSSPGFEKYQTAVAETRASARAIRNILGVDLCSSEEISEITQDVDFKSPIDYKQAKLLEKFKKERGITIEKMQDLVGRKFKNIKDIKKFEASNLIEAINRIRKAKDKQNKDSLVNNPPSKNKEE